MAKIPCSKPIISTPKFRPRHVKSSGILASAALLALFTVPNLTPASASAESTIWTFEETLAARDQYEPIVNAKCNYETACELNEYQVMAQNGEPDAYAAAILASNTIVVTSMHPETGAIKVFFNDRAAVNGHRVQTDAGFVMPLASVNITWHFNGTDQTYTFTDASQILPQQEVELVPTGLELPDGATLRTVKIVLYPVGEHAGPIQKEEKLNKCLSDSNYAPGRECRVLVDSVWGFILRPLVPAAPVTPPFITPTPSDSIQITPIPGPIMPQIPADGEPDSADPAGPAGPADQLPDGPLTSLPNSDPSASPHSTSSASSHPTSTLRAPNTGRP